MKSFLAAICAVFLGCLAGCAPGVPSSPKELVGYPVYKFINFGGIDAEALESNQAEAQEQLGGSYKAYAKRHQAFVDQGFDGYTPVRIVTTSGEEVEIYISNDDYKTLWKTNPLKLAREKKSHLVKITFVQFRVGGEPAKRAISFQGELVEKAPVIRK